MALIGRTSVTAVSEGWEVALKPGKTWTSFEQFRVEGGGGLVESIPEGTVGFLRIRDAEFAILRRRDFSRILGLAQDVRRLSRGIPLLKQAAELVLKSTDQELAIRHFSELTVAFPDVVTTGPAPFEAIEFDVTSPGETLDLETFAPPRATIVER